MGEDHAQHYDEDSLWEKLTSLPVSAGCDVARRALTLWSVLVADSTPLWAKALITGALGYLILPSENLGRAIAAYTAALDVLTRETHPIEWATIQNGLGAAWGDMHAGDRHKNLNRAIHAFTSALTVFTREAHSSKWATTRFKLGLALGERAAFSGNRLDLEAAAAQLRAAEIVFTRTGHRSYSSNRIVPILQAMRTAWISDGHGTSEEFDTIPPAD